MYIYMYMYTYNYELTGLHLNRFIRLLKPYVMIFSGLNDKVLFTSVQIKQKLPHNTVNIFLGINTDFAVITMDPLTTKQIGVTIKVAKASVES